MEILVAVMWFFMSLLVMVQYAPYFSNLKGIALVIVFLIIVFGGPIFTAATAIEGLLSYFFPEGWNDDDDDDENRNC